MAGGEACGQIEGRPMRVAFYCQSGGDHLALAHKLIESVNKAMPGTEIWHLTNESCPAVEGTVTKRLPDDLPMGVRRIQHYSELEGDWLLLDSDVIVQKDVRCIFNGPVEIAVVSRKGTVLEGSDYEKRFPYNFGVVFSRCPKFWNEALATLKRAPRELQEWEGEQLVLGYLADRGGYRVAYLPSSYNWTPESPDEDVTGKHIVHYKGHRKKWLLA